MARIPDSIKHRFRTILEESKANQRFKQILAKGKDENFRWAFEVAMEYGFGKPTNTVDMEVNDVSKRPSLETVEEAIKSIGSIDSGKTVDPGQ